MRGRKFNPMTASSQLCSFVELRHLPVFLGCALLHARTWRKKGVPFWTLLLEQFFVTCSSFQGCAISKYNGFIPLDSVYWTVDSLSWTVDYATTL